MRFDYYLGASASSWALTIMVILAELSKPFKEEFLKALFGHHWLGKLIITTSIFILAGLLLKNKTIFGFKKERCAWYCVMGNLGIIFLFFVFKYFI